MKELKTYIIDEGLTGKQTEIVCDVLTNMFKGSKLNREQVRTLIGNIDMKIIQSWERHLEVADKENALPYMADNDLFLLDEQRDKIVDMLSDYVYKFMANIQ